MTRSPISQLFHPILHPLQRVVATLKNDVQKWTTYTPPTSYGLLSANYYIISSPFKTKASLGTIPSVDIFAKTSSPPIEIPVVAHTPWVKRNIPIPPGIYDEVCRIIQVKMDAGVYKRSNSSYRSRWFCIVKKDTTSLHLVHSLEPLNAVTIQHSGITPFTEHIAEHFASRACGGILNLYIGYDERT